MIVEENEDEEEEGVAKKSREESKVPSSNEPNEKQNSNEAVSLNKSECTPAFKHHNVTSLHRSLRKQDKRMSYDCRPEIY